MKKCFRCENFKPFVEFYGSKLNKDGLRGYCKTCVKVMSGQWYQNHKERCKINQMKWCLKNRDKRSTQNKEWRKKNPEKQKGINKREYAKRKTNKLGFFDMKQWRNILDFYGHVCMACGESKDLTIDHVIPLSKGGIHDHSNIQILCNICNKIKGTKSIDYRKIFQSQYKLQQTELFLKKERSYEMDNF